MCDRLRISICCVLMFALTGMASADLPWPLASKDIGDEGLPGFADVSDNIWTVQGSGPDIGGYADDFHYCYFPWCDERGFETMACIISISDGSPEWAGAGIMIRQTLADNSNHAFVSLANNTPGGPTVVFQWRSVAGGNTEQIENVPGGYSLGDPLWVKIELRDDTLTGFTSLDGETWNELGSHTNVMTSPLYIGLAVTSHDSSRLVTATFDNFLVHGPIPPDECGPYCPGASNPVPADGSILGQSWYWGTYCDIYYMILDYTSCAGAVSHTGYFSDNKTDVDDRDPAHCLGDPPWPAVSETAFVVGYDDPTIPEFARVPLVLGTTYYWCVDFWVGTQYLPGPTWSFTLIPRQTWGPSPADGEECVSAEPTCTWHLGDLDTTGYTLSYNVYCGTDEAAVAAIATGSTTAPLYKGNVTTETIVLADLNPETEYFWRVDTKLKLPRPPFSATYTKGDVWSFTTNCCCMGGILREWWTGIPGFSIADLTNDPNYPDNPDGREILSTFEGPTNVMDNYGSRIHGWLYVTQTGEYTFYIAADDRGELWLSTDTNPANADLIAYVVSPVGPRRWDVYPEQASEPVLLEAGRRYYISALMVENIGDDHIAVAWQGPDTGGVRQIIPHNHLIPYVPVFAENPYPPDRSAEIPLDVTLRWTPGIDQSTDSYYTTQHVYVGSDPVAVAAATTASPEYMAGPTGPNEYGPLSLSYYEKVYWRVDGVEDASGTATYPGSVWTFKAAYDPGEVCDPNLKLWLRFEDNALDSSGYGNDGTEIGGPNYVSGADGQAIHLDGIDDYVDIEYGIGISGDEPRTVAAWVKADTTAIPDWTNVFGFTGPSGNGRHFDIEVVGDTNSTTAGYYGLNLCGDQYDIMPLDLEWHHLAATFDGTWAYFYADAVLYGLAAPAVTIDTHDNVQVGKRDDNDNYFPGSIDDVRIYDVAKLPSIDPPRPIDPWNPCPRHGERCVARDVVLSWLHGEGATMSTVYFGTDDPANMVQVAGPQAATTYNPPGDLDPGTTYYWQIVEDNGNPLNPGPIWKFTTADYLAVDDMESYVPWTQAGDHIFELWRDAFGDCTPGNGNNTGSTLTENADPILGGIQSMKYEFDNDGTVYSPCTMGQESGHLMYSKIEAQTADLPSGIGSDWTTAGVRALAINFYGQTGNPTTEPFWVQLQDGSGYGDKVFYGTYQGESLDDFNEPEWHEWNIDLADFNVDLNDVVSIVIGIGKEDETGDHGSGTLYLDDIRLYIPRCVPARNSAAFAALDYAPEGRRDCKIDYRELAIMARDWLQSDKTVEPQPITSPANIIHGEGPKNLKVNFRDYAELAASWLETEIWPF